MEEVLQEYKNVMAEDESINNPNTNTEPEDPVDPPESETPTVEDSKNNGIEFKEDTEIEDVNGNKIIVPGCISIKGCKRARKSVCVDTSRQVYKGLWN